MKKRIVLLLLVGISVAALVACGGKDDASKIVIGVNPSPHAEIIEFVKEDLEAAGINLEVKEIPDYVTPNILLNDGDLDLNYFQHIPYLEDFNEERSMDLVSLGPVHIEPLALYSNNLKNISELASGDTIAIPNDAVNGGRALILLENNGLIKLDSSAGLEATPQDILENKLDLEIKMLEAATLPSVLGDVDAAVINGNYALEAGLNPVKDGLIIEDSNSPYLNIIAVRKEDSNREDFVKILEIIQSDKVKEFILEKYDGAVVPAF